MLMYFMTKTLAFHTIQKNVWLREIIHEEHSVYPPHQQHRSIPEWKTNHGCEHRF